MAEAIFGYVMMDWKYGDVTLSIGKTRPVRGRKSTGKLGDYWEPRTACETLYGTTRAKAVRRFKLKPGDCRKIQIVEAREDSP